MKFPKPARYLRLLAMREDRRRRNLFWRARKLIHAYYVAAHLAEKRGDNECVELMNCLIERTYNHLSRQPAPKRERRRPVPHESGMPRKGTT